MKTATAARTAPVISRIVLAMVVVLLAADGAAVVIAAREPAALELRTDRLVVMLWTGPWHLGLRDRASGRTLLEEDPVERRGPPGSGVGSVGFLVAPGRVGVDAPLAARPRWHRVTKVLSIARRDDGVLAVAATDDPSGRRLEIELRFTAPGAMTVRIVPQPSDGVLEVAEGLRSEPEEHYLGLGARFGRLDARGSEVRGHVQAHLDTLQGSGNHLPVPFFVSSRSYGVQVHGMDESVFQLNTVRPDAAIFKTRSAVLHFTVFTAPTPLDVVAEHAKAAGPAALPPRWAFGVWKTVVGGEQRVLNEVERIRRERLPVTVLWSYDMVDEARNLGWKRWVYRAVAPGRYGDLTRLTRHLRSLGYRVLGYLSPEVATDSPLFAVGADFGYFVRDARGRPYLKNGMQGRRVALVDFTNPDAVAWWQKVTTSILVDLGFDGWMQDGGDDAPEDGVYGSGTTGPAARNSYPVAYARATRLAAIEARPDYVSFMRTGFAGSQRYTPVAWPCDNVFSWSPREGMPAALRASLNGSLSGIPFWAPDIGGYFGCGLGGDHELWIRWAQLVALHPIMRDHLGDKCRTAVDVWTTPATLDAFRRYATLHQRLVPYLYRAAVEAAHNGRPVMRAVALVSPADPRAYADEFTYLLGDDLLVAPVVERGARVRQLYVPDGEWIDWWNGARHRGPGVVTVTAPLERIPLLVRAGAMLPIGDAWRESAGLTPATD